MKFILFDFIGAHSGTKYYDIAFSNQLKNHGFDVEIHSNYGVSGRKATIKNIFEGNKFRKICNTFGLFFTFINDLIRNRTNVFVYLTFGELVDLILLFLLIMIHKKPLVDVHEFVSTDKENKAIYKKVFSFVYRKIPVIIYHSPRSEQYLRSIGYKGKKLFVPHFRNEFSKNYNVNSICQEVRNCIIDGRINVLFFGHMRRSKGIDTVLDSIKVSNKSTLSRYHFIFAGSDSYNLVENYKSELDKNVSYHAILRFITDEELNFLFENINIVLLPYKVVSQSGILETAVYFRKSMILSDVEYFKAFASMYPSFTYSIKADCPAELTSLYEKLANEGIKQYSEKDLKNFYKYDEFESFFKNLKQVFE